MKKSLSLAILGKSKELSLKFILCFTPFILIAGGIEEANIYHNNSLLQWHAAMDTISLVPWKEDDRVLDVGSGDGKITALLSKKLTRGSILGVDISEAMVNFSSQKYPSVEFQCLSATDISFENQFDRVVSFSTLHWVMDQQKALNAMYRALTAGGSVCILTYGLGPMNVTVIADSLIHTEKWAPYFPSYKMGRVFFTKDEYKTLLENAGFHEVQVAGSMKSTIFSDRQAIRAFVKPLLDFILHLPETVQQEFVEEVIDQIISIAGVSDEGKVHYEVFSIQAFGTK